MHFVYLLYQLRHRYDDFVFAPVASYSYSAVQAMEKKALTKGYSVYQVHANQGDNHGWQKGYIKPGLEIGFFWAKTKTLVEHATSRISLRRINRHFLTLLSTSWLQPTNCGLRKTLSKVTCYWNHLTLFYITGGRRLGYK